MKKIEIIFIKVVENVKKINKTSHKICSEEKCVLGYFF